MNPPLNPLVLAIDTTHEFGSLALVRGSGIVEEKLLHAPAGFAGLLYGELDNLLRCQGIGVGAIDCFAAASGPGSFTGVRIGLACVKGLAEAAGKPAMAVSNLQALACFGGGPLRAVLLDARRGEIYGAVYDDAAQIVTPESVSKLADWLETLPQGVQFVSGDPAMLRDALAGTRFADTRVVAAPRELAGAVGSLAVAKLRSGEAPDPAGLDANYVRRSDAELFWKE